MVREAARGADIPGVKILRERLYPVKINGANRSAVLDSNDNLLPGVSEALGQENEVTIARMNWLSDKGNGKAYGSMVIYVTKESDARRLVEDRYFHLGGESARTSVFESRASVVQCYNYWRLGHKASVCREAQSEDTTIGNARQQSQCACHVEDGTNHSVGHVDCVKCEEMSTRLQVYQLNVRKNDKVRLSMMNDQDLRDYAALAVAEPWACTIEGQVVTTPNYHSNWTKMIPTKTREPRVSRWPIRSMLWIRRDLEAEQVPIPSPDLTAAIVRFPERDVLAVSVYVEGRNEQALEAAMGQLHRAIAEFRNGSGRRTDVILVGDFNRHDTLWGGDEVTGRRQGEAGPIIELMGEHGLHSLLPRGTKTWEGPGGKTSTIDLALASTELADEMTSCGIHPTEHGSDHRAIWTEFDTKPPERTPSDRLLFKNAPWLEIKERTDRLMSVVLDAINDLVPRAKASPYAKRWWTTDLTRLRRMCTYWRNQAMACRRRGREAADLEQKARESSKEYHDAIRRQKKVHWDSFLEDGANIWQSAKYLSPGGEAMGDKIPPLKRRDGTTTSDKAEQAEELLSVFFPPLPAVIEDEERRPVQREIAMPELTLEEVEEKVMAAKAWKAPGEDGLPAMVWEQLWPGVGDQVLHLFQISLRDGELPVQWRSAKIIPLKKLGKDDYKVANAWRLISLLSTLGKILEAVMADRISYVVETFGLLPTNHFGGRKQRSAEQALLLLQGHTYKAWRNRKVPSLISFDVKGAYNGVFKDRLLQRLEARGIPKRLVKWIGAFCSNRSATIVVNGYTSERRELPQAGLPQGSPLSPVPFLFFNADLVQCKIDTKGGSIAFIDDYSAWVTGPTAEANRAIIPERSGKILGLMMDPELRYEEHIKEAATRGLRAAMCLRRLKMLMPRTARQLFVATVAPTMDYASNVWPHRRGWRETKWLNDAQKMGAQAITGAFKTVSVAVAKAEAGILSIGERHAQADTGDDVTETSNMRQVLIATSASARNGLVGMGGVVRNTAGGGVNDHVIAKYSVTLGLRDE
ncbi:RNA-directed DNA polymerase from mobile element jockey [Fusarium oxysporum f. sp. conglutinans]|nr:RNA-directed DNA polymerase from mobile element jockey [Fusarium oxysporum f. sp. conglutinans]